MPQRDRITITIRQDLLRSLDRLIDHQRIRNRSHALEVLLTRTLSSETRQAVILASGQGVKMRPFTYEIPKPLIPVNGRPLLEYSIDLLHRYGINDIVLTVSHLAAKIKNHFGNGSHFGVNISYVHEKKISGTGGALRAAQKKLGDAPFLMLYGDVLLDLDITEFMQVHQNTKASIGTLALTSVADPSAYGAVRMRGTRVVEFSEKPVISNDVSRLVFAGCAAFNPSVFDFLQKRGQLSLERDVFPELISQGRLFGYPFEGQWFDVSTHDVYEQVLKQWRG
ncbi:MAG: sugar phosphate nucleotidyltransferase [Candidatus Andersenbacteria bacterium]|nr:sugar phosphate nucleotidyltransferase [bacterium]MDZ4225260.1 sugar phosphate nucleotidyltransferase [Candidatus Andersenbacteria bacterium]